MPVGERTGVVEGTGLAFQERQIVDRIEEKAFAAPVAAVPRDQLILEDHLNVVDCRHHRDLAVGVLHRHAVAVGVEAHQRQRIGLGLRDPPCLALLRRKRQEGTPLLLEPLSLRAILAPQSPGEIRPAAVLERLVEIDKRRHARHGHEEVRPAEVDEAFDVPFLVGPPHQAKLRIEEVMALEPLKLPRHLSLAAAGDLCHCDLAVVVADLSRHATNESERTIVALEKGLGALPWKCLDKDGVGVRQRHHEQRHLLPLTSDVDVREAKVDLGLARRVRERHEDFLPGVLPLPDRRFHHRDAAGVVPLCLQPVENPLRRVVLLLGRFLVLLQYLVDPRQMWPQNRFLTLRPTAISGRLGVREHLPERSPVDAVFLAGRPL